MNDLGRMLIVLGLLIAAAGAVVLLLGRTSLPLGRLPGDFTWKGRNTTVYVPLGTCILISVALTLLFWILGRLHK
jgi:ribose/xylose/arabinose/galactoside ABC-type transport system permease subunit